MMTLRPKIALATLVLAAAASRLPAAGLGDYSLTVLVDGAPVPEYGARGRVYIEALKGRTFSLRLTNPTSERVAVALSVDGRNVIDAKRTDAGTATKWILLPGQTAEIPGWQISGDTSRRFFFTETRRSYAKWLGDTANVGTIEAVFYREKRRVAAAAPPPRWMPWLEKKAEAEREASAAPAAPASEEGQGQMTRRDSAAGSLAENRQTQAKAQAKTADSFAATGIGERTAFSVEWVSFDEESSPAARVSLRYEFRPELLRLGVIPREDELYARDRGRGFDREYAPDPYRHR